MNRPQKAKLAEIYVAEQLAHLGWQIIKQDWRTPFAQIDILALDPTDSLVVVEVKARHPLSWAQGGDAIGGKQIQRLTRALSWLLQDQHWHGRLGRVDLALVSLPTVRGQPIEIISDIKLT